MRRLVLVILLAATPVQCEQPPGFMEVGVAWPSDAKSGTVSLEIR